MSIVLLALATVAVVGTIRTLTDNTSGDNSVNPSNFDNVLVDESVFTGKTIFFVNNIVGNSMEPLFGEGDNIYYIEVDDVTTLKIGDIIVFQRPNRPEGTILAHRIYRIYDEGTRFETKGDNNEQTDAQSTVGPFFVTEPYIYGLVIGVNQG